MDTTAPDVRLPRHIDRFDPENFLQRANFEDTFWDCTPAAGESRRSIWWCRQPPFRVPAQPVARECARRTA